MFKIKFSPEGRQEMQERFDKEWTIGDSFKSREECVVGTRVMYAGIPVPATIVDNSSEGPSWAIKIKFDHQPPSVLGGGTRLPLGPGFTYSTWHPGLLRKIKRKID